MTFLENSILWKKVMQSFFVSKKRVLEHDGHNVFF